LKRTDSKKPRVVSVGKKTVSAAKPKAAGKAKNRKKLTLHDRFTAVIAAAVVVLVAVVSFGVMMYIRAVSPPLAPEAAALVSPAIPAPDPTAPTAPHEYFPAAYIAPPPQPPSAGSAGTLVFVIDDAGNNLRDLEPFLNFPGALTIAVLPGLPHSAEAARRIRAAGKELFLHQPMEAVGGTDPGPGAIMAGMDSGEIRDIINRNLAEIGSAAGMNNHEGSRITMDETAMETILALSHERGLLFLDSRTTAETAAGDVARRLGIIIAERDIFVDNSQEREAMLYFINQGLERARQRGFVVMIGHAWSHELAPLLQEIYADLLEQGFAFSSVTDAVARRQL